MTTIGYARVSIDGQTLDAQHSALREADCAEVFAEKVSGAKTDRQQLAKALAGLGTGDTLIVTKLDRLARSTRDWLNTLDAIAKAGATFKSLGDGLGRHNHSAFNGCINSSIDRLRRLDGAALAPDRFARFLQD